MGSMRWVAQYISIGIHVLEKEPQASTTSKEEEKEESYTYVSGECVGKRQAFNG